MQRVLIVGLSAIVLLASNACKRFGRANSPGDVMVHCSNAGRDAFVTPRRVQIDVGQVVTWKSTGQTIADSMRVELKQAAVPWPFDGPPPSGDSTATTGKATTAGTYSYTIYLQCRQPGGGTRPDSIDPDIIIRLSNAERS